MLSVLCVGLTGVSVSAAAVCGGSECERLLERLPACGMSGPRVPSPRGSGNRGSTPSLPDPPPSHVQRRRASKGEAAAAAAALASSAVSDSGGGAVSEPDGSSYQPPHGTATDATVGDDVDDEDANGIDEYDGVAVSSGGSTGGDDAESTAAAAAAVLASTSGNGNGNGYTHREDEDDTEPEPRRLRMPHGPELVGLSKYPYQLVQVPLPWQHAVSRNECKLLSPGQKALLVQRPVRIMLCAHPPCGPDAQGRLHLAPDNVWFVAKDVAQLLHIHEANVSRRIAAFLPHERARMPVLCLQSNGTKATLMLSVLSVAGMTRLLTASKKAVMGTRLHSFLSSYVRELCSSRPLMSSLTASAVLLPSPTVASLTLHPSSVAQAHLAAGTRVALQTAAEAGTGAAAAASAVATAASATRAIVADGLEPRPSSGEGGTPSGQYTTPPSFSNGAFGNGAQQMTTVICSPPARRNA